MTDNFVHLDQAGVNTAKIRGEKGAKSVTDNVSAIAYKEEELRDDQMDRHKEAEIFHGNE